MLISRGYIRIDMSIKKHIPNAITSMNLLCGVLSTAFAVSGNVRVAALLVFAGALFDFCDGFAARMLHVSSEIGRELDSLADLVSFGIAPAAMYSTYIKYSLVGNWTFELMSLNTTDLILTLLPFFLAVAAALRLAKFNLDTRQTENFLGLTTTATGLFTASLIYTIYNSPEQFAWLRPWGVIVMIAVFCLLLNSEIPMFSLKLKHFAWRGNELRYTIIAIAIAAIAIFGVGGIALTILIYTVFSLIKTDIK